MRPLVWIRAKTRDHREGIKEAQGQKLGRAVKALETKMGEE